MTLEVHVRVCFTHTSHMNVKDVENKSHRANIFYMVCSSTVAVPTNSLSSYIWTKHAVHESCFVQVNSFWTDTLVIKKAYLYLKSSL